MVCFDNIFAIPNFFNPQKKKEYAISIQEDFCRPEYAKDAKHYFWFPVDELHILNSLSSIYAILKIIHYWKLKNVKEIYINCSAGAVRSPLIVESYRYLITGEVISNLDIIFRHNKNNIDYYLSFLDNFKKYEIEERKESLTLINYQTFNLKVQ